MTDNPLIQKAEIIVSEFHSPPPTRNVEMTVMWGGMKGAYKVLSIKNTTWYRPGIWLTEDVVAKVCQLKNWQVTIIDDELWRNVFSFIGGKLPGITVP